MASLKERIRFIRKDRKNLSMMILKKLSPLFSDRTYLKLIFRLGCGYKLDFDNPKTFNEKLNWLKLNNRDPRLTTMADKYAVKKFVADLVGEEYVVPNYGVWDRFEDIDFDALPQQFVLKTTHDSGGVIVCKDKSTFDFDNYKKRITELLNKDFYYLGREWPYKNIPHRIIADKFLDDHTGKELRDYKFWCFNGEPKYCYLTIKGENIFENFYDMDFNTVDINHCFPRHIPEFEKPTCFEKMKELAKVLSSGVPFVRVDFFQVDNKVYFGEFTFFDWGGKRAFSDYETDLKLGELIQL